MQPKDFYFEYSKQAEEPCFLITPRTYYDLEGVLSDESGVADAVVPEGFYELAESMYEYDGNIEHGRQLLLDAGFQEISFGLTPGETSQDTTEEYNDEEEEYDEIDTLLQEDNEPHPFDYKNVSTDKLLRHLTVMVSTDAFEEAAKIRDELKSRENNPA